MNNMHISTNKSELDIVLVHKFLSEQSTWANGIPFETVMTSIENSLCFGGYLVNTQIAFARVITDYATFANLVDVFVLPEYRGQGHGRAILEAVILHPKLQGLRRFTLATRDLQGFYSKFGFSSLRYPQSFMERYSPDIYLSQC